MSWRRTLLPWSGTIAGVLGWSLSHQIGSNSVFDDCTARGGGFVLAVGIVALLFTIAGGVVSLAVWRGMLITASPKWASNAASTRAVAAGSFAVNGYSP